MYCISLISFQIVNDLCVLMYFRRGLVFKNDSPLNPNTENMHVPMFSFPSSTSGINQHFSLEYVFAGTKSQSFHDKTLLMLM